MDIERKKWIMGEAGEIAIEGRGEAVYPLKVT
jgi:hypothetical protein